MKCFLHLLLISILTYSLATLSAHKAEAGRVSGPTSWPVVLQGYQSVAYNIPFAAGSMAAISVSGNGTSNVSLVVSDGAGNNWVGDGYGSMKTVTFNVVQEGTFRVVIQNLGSQNDMFVLRTN
jgi:hypothetical protein